MRKLNMWQRLGIVLSLLWIVVGGMWQRNYDTLFAAEAMEAQYQPCSEKASNLPTGADAANDRCMSEALKTYNVFLEGSWMNAAFFAFGPVILGWLLAYVILWVSKWVLAGRKISN